MGLYIPVTLRKEHKDHARSSILTYPGPEFYIQPYSFICTNTYIEFGALVHKYRPERPWVVYRNTGHMYSEAIISNKVMCQSINLIQGGAYREFEAI